MPASEGARCVTQVDNANSKCHSHCDREFDLSWEHKPSEILLSLTPSEQPITSFSWPETIVSRFYIDLGGWFLRPQVRRPATAFFSVTTHSACGRTWRRGVRCTPCYVLPPPPTPLGTFGSPVSKWAGVFGFRQQRALSCGCASTESLVSNI